MPVTAPADRRFRRAHLKPGRKRAGFTSQRWRAAIVVVVVGLALYAGHRAVAVVARLEMFHIDHINVRGNQRLSNGEVLAMLQNLRGRSVLAVDLSEWRRALLNSPWVADASLRRTLPSTVDVVILERAPLGIGRINGLLYLVDDRGAVIDEYGPNYADLDLPIIDGLSGAPSAVHPSAGAAFGDPPGAISGAAAGEESLNVYRALLARRLLDALRVRNMSGQISQIDVSDSRNAVVLLEGDPTLIRLGNERFVERLQSYYELAPALRERVPAIDYVDLRFDERVYVRPARAGQAPPAGMKTAPVKGGRPTQTG
jgi:cell division septal protein FtsQ